MFYVYDEDTVGIKTLKITNGSRQNIHMAMKVVAKNFYDCQIQQFNQNWLLRYVCRIMVHNISDFKPPVNGGAKIIPYSPMITNNISENVKGFVEMQTLLDFHNKEANDIRGSNAQIVGLKW